MLTRDEILARFLVDAEMVKEFSPRQMISQVGKYVFFNGPEGLTCFFELLDGEKKGHFFECSARTVDLMAQTFAGLAEIHNRNFGQLHAEKGCYRYATHKVESAITVADTNLGAVVFRFVTELGDHIETTIGPGLCEHLLSTLTQSLSFIPRKEQVATPHIQKVDGREQEAGEHVTFFNQRYPTDILQSLGVLMIRANILEEKLTVLFAALTKMAHAQAKGIFAATSNFDAKISLTRAALSDAEIDTDGKIAIGDLLDRARKVSIRRNSLVHGTWQFKDGKFTVSNERPKAKEKQALTVNSSFIDEISALYNSVGYFISRNTELVEENNQRSSQLLRGSRIGDYFDTKYYYVSEKTPTAIAPWKSFDSSPLPNSDD